MLSRHHCGGVAVWRQNPPAPAGVQLEALANEEDGHGAADRRARQTYMAIESDRGMTVARGPRTLVSIARSASLREVNSTPTS